MTAAGVSSVPEASTVEPYENSVAVARLRDRIARDEALRVAFLDIDSTLTGCATLADTVRLQLDAAGYVVIFNSSRTEEMMMSAHTYDLTRRAGLFFRPRPLPGGTEGHRMFAPPEECGPSGLLDGDIIAGSTGTRIMVKQPDGAYLPDRDYEQVSPDVSPEQWRATALDLAGAALAGGCRGELAAIESPRNYHNGVSDVFPPDRRVQLHFECEADKLRYVERLWQEVRRDRSGSRMDIRVTDDSSPDTGHYKVFLTPRRAGKAQASQRIIRRFCAVLDMEPATFSLLVAGDSFPDLEMGFWGGLGTTATLLLVGGSRLAHSLTQTSAITFAGEPIAAIRKRLVPDAQRGHFHLRLPFAHLGMRRIIIGEKAFPGTEAVQTVVRFLETV